MNDFTKIMIAALLAIVVVAWAAPSEARNRHFRSAHGRHSVQGHKSLGFHGKLGRHRLRHRHRSNHRRHRLKPHYARKHRNHHYRYRPHHGRHYKSHYYHRGHRSYYKYGPYRYYYPRGYDKGYLVYSGTPHNFAENTQHQAAVQQPSPVKESQVAARTPTPSPEPKERWVITNEWVPPKVERVTVPGHWAHGIKKTWTGSHWKYETDRSKRIWVEETNEWQEKQAGYYRERKVLAE